MQSDAIYHLVPLSELRAGVKRGAYTPARFAEDGFVHCADRGSVLAVASDFYSGLREPLLLLAIDPARLDARVVREPPSPIPGGGVAHLEGVTLFPHVYGPIGLAAITSVATLRRHGDTFLWPDRFEGVGEILGDEDG